MNDTTINPRDVAQALDMDTMDLARVLTKWAGEALPTLDFDHKWEPTPLDSFDESVARARRLLESAHEAMAAWNLDNPPEPDEA